MSEQSGDSAAEREGEELSRSGRLTLQATGVTLLGVILSISLTIAFGIKTAIWIKVLAGFATAVLLVAVVKLSSHESAALRRAADWLLRAGPR